MLDACHFRLLNVVVKTGPGYDEKHDGVGSNRGQPDEADCPGREADTIYFFSIHVVAGRKPCNCKANRTKDFNLKKHEKIYPFGSKLTFNHKYYDCSVL